MPLDPIHRKPDTGRSAALAGYALLALNLAILLPIALYVVESATDVLRGGIALMLAVVLIRWLARNLASLGPVGANALQPLGRVLPPPEAMDPALRKWRQDIGFSRSSRRYFDRVFWPRLVGLAGTRDLGRHPVPSAPVRWLKRGPTLGQLAELVRRLEGGR
ncbi:MAG: hypothetical protein HYR63_10555 [Proteobacteria bacterium]|nr:hypothetical protein [Pseudomonadota bacterium]MBI3499363.1 hypothetical protein [Pseudomonadota bacterium]